MITKDESDRLLLGVKLKHTYSSKDHSRHGVYVMHPLKKKSGEGAGRYSIRKDSNTRLKQYVTDDELAELFAVNAFSSFGINLRMLPLGNYDGGPPPALKPLMSDVVVGLTFASTVEMQRVQILQHGLSGDLHAKLAELGVVLPSALHPRKTMALSTSAIVNIDSKAANASLPSRRRTLSEADLLDILNRQRENGAAGERIAIEWEKKRLTGCGCSAPDDFVKHTSKEDVGAGFDIHSHWPGDQERFIEVKTTAGGANYFYMSENEKEVLTLKAEKSYIYIVDLDASGADTGTVRTPINFSETELEFEPVAYRVRVKSRESPK